MEGRKINCRSCGNEVDVTGGFCQFCGTPLREVKSQYTLPVPRSRKNPPLLLVIGAIIIAIIIIVAMLSIITPPTNDNPKDSDGDGYPDDEDDFPNDPNYHKTYSLIDEENFDVGGWGQVCSGIDFDDGRCWDWSLDYDTKHIGWSWFAEDSLTFEVLKIEYPSYDVLYHKDSFHDWDSIPINEAGRYAIVLKLREPSPDDVLVHYMTAWGID